MMKSQVHTPADALAYLTDCTLATVCRMAMRKSRPKGEYERQIAIAEAGVQWMIEMGVPRDTYSRAAEVEKFGSVAAWAESVATWAKCYKQTDAP